MGLFDGKSGTYIKIAIAAVTLAVAVFDIFSDWFAFGKFVRLDGEKLTTALGIFCVISSLLFVLEVRNCIVAIKLYRSEDDIPQNNPRQQKLERWQETVSFLLMILEDLPNTAILYAAFRSGNCTLFYGVFEESNVANLALLGSFISALWKLVLSIRYCCCNCCNYHDMKGIVSRCCCCCARVVRPFFAIVLMGISAFLFFTFNNQGTKYRSDCYDDITTLVPSPAP